MDGDTNLSPASAFESSQTRARFSPSRSPYRPPTKCLPVKCFTNGFGAVRLIKAVGMKELPTPDCGGPFSMSHDDGASTDVTGILVSWRAWITAGNGSRTSPEKLKPGTELAEEGRLRLETKRTEYGVHDMVGRAQGGTKIVDEGHVEIFKLFCESLSKRSATVAGLKRNKRSRSEGWTPKK